MVHSLRVASNRCEWENMKYSQEYINQPQSERFSLIKAKLSRIFCYFPNNSSLLAHVPFMSCCVLLLFSTALASRQEGTCIFCTGNVGKQWCPVCFCSNISQVCIVSSWIFVILNYWVELVETFVKHCAYKTQFHNSIAKGQITWENLSRVSRQYRVPQNKDD